MPSRALSGEVAVDGSCHAGNIRSPACGERCGSASAASAASAALPAGSLASGAATGPSSTASAAVSAAATLTEGVHFLLVDHAVTVGVQAVPGEVDLPAVRAPARVDVDPGAVGRVPAAGSSGLLTASISSTWPSG